MSTTLQSLALRSHSIAPAPLTPRISVNQDLSHVQKALIHLTLEEGQARKEVQATNQASIITLLTHLQETIDDQAADILLLKKQLASSEQKRREESQLLRIQLTSLNEQISSLQESQGELRHLNKQQMKTLQQEHTTLSTILTTNLESFRSNYNSHTHSFYYYGIGARTQGGTEVPHPQSTPSDSHS